MSFGKSSSDKGQSGKGQGAGGIVSAALGGAGTRVDPGGNRSGNQAAFLGLGSKVYGKLVFSGPAVLSGEVEGEIKADSHLEIGESAVVQAKIEGVEVVVKGIVEGDVIATSRLELFRPGKILGNISCGSLQIEDGAVFEGSCQMLKKSVSSSTTQSISVTPSSGQNLDSKAKK